MIEPLMAQWESQSVLILDVVIAIFLGGLIGLEREIAHKPAGFRTHMLVAGVSAMLVGLSDVLLQRFTVEIYGNILRTDPIRIVEAIITGISFLGAGTIFRSEKGQTIEGLTTAASILVCSAIGIAVALKQLVLAVGVTLLSVFLLYAASYIERRFSGRQ